ncbi:MAG: substrate-binding domain-containing protein [Pirellulales bacterium]|nr:substrate-binding domain-containing protein [Pirellulales bacterium]
MLTQNENFSIVGHIANRLEADIRGRGLRQGARYLSTVDAGRMLGVSPATAHRAMQLLVDKNLLVRRTRSGTFVGPAAGTDIAHRIRTIQVLTTPEKRAYASAYASHLLRGLGRAIPDVNVQFTFIPSHDPAGFVKDLLDSANATGEIVGFVAASCPCEVYRVLSESGVPTVVTGTLPLDGPDLPSVTLDDFEGGRLLTEYLLKRGHRRIALLATTLDRPGDKLLFDGIGNPLTRAGLPHNSLVFQVVMETASSVEAAVRHFLEMPDRPTAFIARSERLADMVNTSLSEIGPDAVGDIEIVFLDYKTETVEQSPLPHVQSKRSHEEGARLIGEMLQKLHEGQTIDQRRIVAPVEFIGGK